MRLAVLVLLTTATLTAGVSGQDEGDEGSRLGRRISQIASFLERVTERKCGSEDAEQKQSSLDDLKDHLQTLRDYIDDECVDEDDKKSSRYRCGRSSYGRRSGGKRRRSRGRRFGKRGRRSRGRYGRKFDADEIVEMLMRKIDREIDCYCDSEEESLFDDKKSDISKAITAIIEEIDGCAEET